MLFALLTPSSPSPTATGPCLKCSKSLSCGVAFVASWALSLLYHGAFNKAALRRLVDTTNVGFRGPCRYDRTRKAMAKCKLAAVQVQGLSTWNWVVGEARFNSSSERMHSNAMYWVRGRLARFSRQPPCLNRLHCGRARHEPAEKEGKKRRRRRPRFAFPQPNGEDR
jgi:hypothetical protein